MNDCTVLLPRDAHIRSVVNLYAVKTCRPYLTLWPMYFIEMAEPIVK